jgi:hypothetical protein
LVLSQDYININKLLGIKADGERKPFASQTCYVKGTEKLERYNETNNRKNSTSKVTMTLTKCLSCVDLPSHVEPKNAVDKRVRWSIELEEIRYYKPAKNPRAKVLGSKLKNVRRRASILAERAATNFINIPNGLSFVLRHRSSSYVIGDCEENPNKAWDELFELYGGL